MITGVRRRRLFSSRAEIKKYYRSFYEPLKSGFDYPNEQTKYEHHGYFLHFPKECSMAGRKAIIHESEIKIL